MIQEATPFLNFSGECHEAIALYEKALGATVVDRRPWDPAMFDGGVVPEAMKNGVMYARLQIGSVPLEMSDMPPTMKAIPGTNLSINLHLSDPNELDKCFAALSEGGSVAMPPENMFWGARYGKLTDRFGISWSMHCQLS
jgi:PhnB protein